MLGSKGTILCIVGTHSDSVLLISFQHMRTARVRASLCMQQHALKRAPVAIDQASAEVHQQITAEQHGLEPQAPWEDKASGLHRVKQILKLLSSRILDAIARTTQVAAAG